jgi:RNA-splicing ligase RtcB
MKNLKIYAKTLEKSAKDQIDAVMEQNIFEGCRVRIMPDCHAGTGCVIGFTSQIGNKIVPNLVGVDIGCGVSVLKLGDCDINLPQLDEIIRKSVPSGFSVHNKTMYEHNIDDLYCLDQLKNVDRIKKSVGSLGGGNHFIEVDIDDDGNKYLLIHTGSRNLGKQVADYYQKKAISIIYDTNDIVKMRNDIIESCKARGEEKLIAQKLNESNKIKKDVVPKDLCYLTGEEYNKYLHDLKICQSYAVSNRWSIEDIILSELGIGDKPFSGFESVHNYIDPIGNIIRKGAIRANKGKELIIPLNMRDGSLLCVGKGNDDWNCSAPHGAGRLMSRKEAKEKVDLEDFKNSMNGIYTTSVNASTVDESPFAYKDWKEIAEAIEPTAEIIKHLKPIYNFKAGD